MFLEEIEQEIFSKYKHALYAIGVNFEEDDTLTEIIENCNSDLEGIIQAFISWYVYLKKKGDKIYNPNEVLIQAFMDRWKPYYWDDNDLFFVLGKEGENLIPSRNSRVS